jgi:flagellin-like hook-associated protein FlgL
MPVVINTNTAATMASNNLASSSAALQKSLNRLSSGSKIVSPEDDAGGLAVSMKLGATAHRQAAVASNIANSNSYLQTQDGALKVVGSVLNRIGELKTLSLDPTKNASDIANYDAEFTQLRTQLTSLGSETFNGIALFGSSTLSVATTEDAATTVTVGGANVLGTALFPTLTDNFANLNNWTDQSSGGGARYLNGSSMDLWGNVGGTGAASSIQSFSGPFHLSMGLNITGGNHTFTMKLGGTTILTANGLSNAGSNTVTVDYDGSGTVTRSINGVVTTLTGVGTLSGNIAMSNTPNGDAQISSFQMASTSATGGVSAATNASNLASLSISGLSTALQNVASMRADNGAQQSRLGFAAEVLTTNKANIEAANSRIIDVDVAAESTQLARYNVLTQAGTAMLSQANQSTQIALKLLG